jgi:hypothetical protein
VRKHHVMWAYRKRANKAHAFDNSALDGSERSALRSDQFSPGERAPGTHWIGGWVDHKSGADMVSKRKDSDPPEN